MGPGWWTRCAAWRAVGLREGRTASRALGYAQVLRFLAGECTEEEAREETVRATRRFARRQESWFRRDPRVHWLAPDGRTALAAGLPWTERSARGDGASVDRPSAGPRPRGHAFAKGHGTENDFVILPDPDGRWSLDPRRRRGGVRPARRDRRGRGAARGAHGRRRPRLGQPGAAEAEWFMDYRNADGASPRCAATACGCSPATWSTPAWPAGPTFGVATRAGVGRSG